MGNLGPLEIGLILAGFVLLFGARKLPELGGSIGKSIQNFKRGMHDAGHDEADPDAATTTATRVDPVPPAEERTATRVE